MKAVQLIIGFLLASFIGWGYEAAASLLIYGEYYDRGMLKLPICPIYGFGILILLLALHKVKNGVKIFLYSAVITTVFELLCSYILEALFHDFPWNYEDWPLQFQGRVSLISSLIFGVLALFFMKLLNPFLTKICSKCKPKYVYAFTIVLLAGLGVAEIYLGTI